MALTEDPLWASTQSAIWGTAEAVGHPARRAAVAEVDRCCSLSRNRVSCGWPDFNVESEIADAVGELGCRVGWVTADEMIPAEVLVASAIGQHVVGGSQDRGRHGNNSFFGAAACF